MHNAKLSRRTDESKINTRHYGCALLERWVRHIFEINKMYHELKILPAFFEAVIRGEKKFEIRNNNDRGFQKGDAVLLREIIPSAVTTLYSGRQQLVTISYVSDYNQPDNQVVFAFSLTGDVIHAD